MRRHFEEAVNPTNETDEEIQGDEQELEDNETEEDEYDENESDREDEGHRTFQGLLDNPIGRELERQLKRDFGSVLFIVARREVTGQARLPGCDPIKIPDAFRQWWFVDLELSHKIDPDKHWREVHGCEGHGQLAHIALRFLTAGTSEAEVERALGVHRHIQRIHETDYRTDTIHARFVLHEKR
jgi:hypothetical protein